MLFVSNPLSASPRLISNLSRFPVSTLRPKSLVFFLCPSSSTTSNLGLSSGVSQFFSRNCQAFHAYGSLFSRVMPPRTSSPIRAVGTDHYSTLNVGRNATLQEIKSSYRKLARKVLLMFTAFLFCLVSGKVKGRVGNYVAGILTSNGIWF